MSAFESTCVVHRNSKNNGYLNEEVNELDHDIDANGDFYNTRIKHKIGDIWDEDIASSSSKDETDETIIHLKTR